MIILGSSSPRRRDLLKNIFYNFHQLSPDVDESRLELESPIDYTLRIAKNKSQEIFLSTHQEFPQDETNIIIAGDTTVSIGNVIFGKPIDFEDATSTLKFLSGKTHSVISSISIIYNTPENPEFQKIIEYEETLVTFKQLSIDKIKDYLDSIEYMDKAGSYAIQDNGDMIVEKINGSETNIIGFPMRLFLKMIIGNGLI